MRGLRLLKGAVIAAAALCAGACTPIGVFNHFTPTDPAIRHLTGQAYGPEPRQTLDLYAPPALTKAAPVAVFFYGGSWNSGRRQDYEWAARALADKGFVVVVPDYRLYPNVRFPDFLDDSAQAVRWAQDHAAGFGGDPGRIVLVGHSAGAYNAVMLGLDPSYLQKAGVDPEEVRAVAGLAGPYDFLPLRESSTHHTFGKAKDLAATQPVNLARADAPAFFLATGESDAVVPAKETRALAKALRKAGANVEDRYYPGVGHNEVLLALSKPFRGRVSVLDDVTEFFRTRTSAAFTSLSGRAQAATKSEKPESSLGNR